MGTAAQVQRTVTLNEVQDYTIKAYDSTGMAILGFDMSNSLPPSPQPVAPPGHPLLHALPGGRLWVYPNKGTKCDTGFVVL